VVGQASLAPEKRRDGLGKDTIELGWREWLSLPDLGIDRIKAKVDTGARTSALHAFEVSDFTKNGKSFVRFKIHPLQRNNDKVVECVAAVIDRRLVSDSGGHKEHRWVIQSDIHIGAEIWPSEITLTSRDTMLFRMLLGRTALSNRAVVNPACSYLLGKRLK
jgi:hypothetical protein